MKYLYLTAFIIIPLIFSACGSAANQSAANTPPLGSLVKTDRPAKIAELIKQRGEQEEAKPVLKILEPAADATIPSSTVKVKLEISGDLKGYMPGMNAETHTGNHIHVILDNQPYEAYYDLGQEFELRNVSDGEHTLRVFPSRPWHESYKNEGAFQMVSFKVKNGGSDPAKPATTGNGEQMSNSAAPAETAKPTPEGKDMKESTAGAVDPKNPLLTFSRPKGEYKGADASEIMIDFWLSNAILVGDGGQFRVRLLVDDKPVMMIEKWEPVWFKGWADGKRTVKLELVDSSGTLVDNGGYNSTTREIAITTKP